MKTNNIVLIIIVVVLIAAGAFAFAQLSDDNTNANTNTNSSADKMMDDKEDGMEKDDDKMMDGEDAMEKEDDAMMDDEMEKEDDAMMKDDADSMEKDDAMEGDAMEKEDDAMEKDDQAATSTPGTYRDYDAGAVAQAATDGDAVLFFHASWCPTCSTLNRNINANLDSIPDGVTIFKTDYDSETELKRKYNVTYQHTLVQVDANGDMIAKWSGGNTVESIADRVQ